MADTADIADIRALLAHADWLRGLARRLVGPSGADDAVQETYVAALRSPPAADKPARPWLARVLRNATRMEHRGATRRARREDALAAGSPTSAAAPDDAIARVETFRTLVELVLALDEPLRTTLVRHYFDGDSLADIARQGGVPEGTVRWRHKQALDRLREKLDARAGGDRRAWLAALAPLAAPPSHAAAVTTGALVMNKILVGAALAAVVGGVVTWRLVAQGAEAPSSAARGSASAAAGASTPAASAPGLAATVVAGSAGSSSATHHVRQLASGSERAALVAEIASAHARRAAARAALSAEAARDRGAAPAPLQGSGSDGLGALDKDTIRGAMREVLPFLGQCFDDARGALGSDHLEIHAHFTITGDPDVGSLVDAKQLFDDDNRPLPTQLDDCLRSTVQTLELPPLGDGEIVEVNYPLIFAANGSGSD